MVSLRLELPLTISIHAPSRERRFTTRTFGLTLIFQSTLPRGSDRTSLINVNQTANFNPRSLAGATSVLSILFFLAIISIHAPSRERQSSPFFGSHSLRFQSTLPRGSDDFYWPSFAHLGISIHAPSRERPDRLSYGTLKLIFQSTLPRGSDG